jgi:hypothetical protein
VEDPAKGQQPVGFRAKDSTSARQKIAAPQDFNPANVSCGVTSAIEIGISGDQPRTGPALDDRGECRIDFFFRTCGNDIAMHGIRGSEFLRGWSSKIASVGLFDGMPPSGGTRRRCAY